MKTTATVREILREMLEERVNESRVSVEEGDNVEEKQGRKVDVNIDVVEKLPETRSRGG